jgi:DNA-directed RNA polymerase subunit M/transcription elongation factor TFIIS
MRYCPECGGQMAYISAMKRHVCKSCGLSLTLQEIIEMRGQLRERVGEEDEKKRVRKEYLKWWLSKKK